MGRGRRARGWGPPSAPLRSAPLNSALLRSAPLRSAPLRSALRQRERGRVGVRERGRVRTLAPLSPPRRASPLHSASLRFAPLRSTLSARAEEGEREKGRKGGMDGKGAREEPLLHSSPLLSAPRHAKAGRQQREAGRSSLGKQGGLGCAGLPMLKNKGIIL